MAWKCEQWGALPDAGGLHDQDYLLMYRMSAFTNIHRAVSRWFSLEGSDIHKLTDAERRILRSLQDMGLMFNAKC